MAGRFLLFLVFLLWPLAGSSSYAFDAGDPFATGGKIAAYGSGLKPSHCPPPPDLTQEITLGVAVVAILCDNPEARSSYLSLLASADSYGGTLMSYLPDISASVSAGTSRSRTLGEDNIASSSGVSVSTGMTLYDFGRREANLAIAERTLIAAGMSYDSALQGFIAGGLQAYFAMLTAQNALSIERESLALSEKILDAAETRYQLGLVPLSDALQARTSYSQAKLALEQSENTLTLARAALAQQMGISPLSEFKVAELDDPQLTAPPFKNAVLELIEKAKQQRIDLKTQRLSLKNAEDSFRNTKRRHLPSISASAASSYSDWDIVHRNERSDSIGVSVSIPIFTGFGAVFSERAERKQLETQRLQLINAERGVEQDVLRSWQNFNTARLNLSTVQSSLESARLLKDVSIGRYQEGIGSILDVLGAQVSYRNSLQSLLSSRYNTLTARVDLVRSVGELDLRSIESALKNKGNAQAGSEAGSNSDAQLPELAEIVTYKTPQR